MIKGWDQDCLNCVGEKRTLIIPASLAMVTKEQVQTFQEGDPQVHRRVLGYQSRLIGIVLHTLTCAFIIYIIFVCVYIKFLTNKYSKISKLLFYPTLKIICLLYISHKLGVINWKSTQGMHFVVI